jgi:hypothetical protein
MLTSVIAPQHLRGAGPLGVCCSLVQYLVIFKIKYYIEIMFSGFNVVYSDKAGLGVTYKIMSTRFILVTGYACVLFC